MRNSLYLVVDPRVVVINSIVADCVQSKVLVKPVDNLNLLELDDYASCSTAGHIIHLISLHSDLDFVVTCYVGQHHVPAWLTDAAENGTTTIVHSDVALVDLVKCRRN